MAEQVFLNINWNTTNHAASTMYWDDTNKRIGINQSTPIYLLDVNGSINTSTALIVNGASSGPTLTLDTGRYGVQAVRFQTQVTNGSSAITVMPNGSSTEASFRLYNTSDPANTGAFEFDLTGTTVTFNSEAFGAGSAPVIIDASSFRTFKAQLVVLTDNGGIQSDTVALTGQTGSIGATNLVASPTATSLYQIAYYLNDTTAGTSGTVTLTITWNDGASQSFTSAAVTFGTLGAYVSGTLIVKATSGAIQYSTTVTSAIGSPQYSLDIRVLPLG